MAVVIPYTKQTWTDDVSDCSAARNNVHEDGINDAHYQPAVRGIITVALSLANNTWTLIPWTSEAFDTAGNVASTMHDNSTNPARLTARHAGKYAFVTVHQWNNNTGGLRACQVQKNSEALPAASGTGVVHGGYNQGSVGTSSGTGYSSASGIVDMAVNDYLACVVLQTTGGLFSLQVDSYFAMWRVG